jgi:glycosyltransferase involved in cell wall biosynthesis
VPLHYAKLQKSLVDEKMKIVVFGIGKYYQNRAEELHNILEKDTDEIVAFIDNGGEISRYEDKSVYKPDKLAGLMYDYVVIMSSYYDEMYSQLISLGVRQSDILDYYAFKRMKELIQRQGDVLFYSQIKQPLDSKKGKVLLVQNGLTFNGGPVALMQAAMVLRSKGYQVTFATGDSPDEQVIRYINEMGMSLCVFQSYPYIGGRDLDVVKEYDSVIVNVFPSIPYAYEFSSVRPTLWWIHENPDGFGEAAYAETKERFYRLDASAWMNRPRIVAVNNRAKDVFESYYPGKVKDTMAYGLPDEGDVAPSLKKGEKIVFAIVGTVIQRKGQDLFIEAAKRLTKRYPGKCEFWIVGGYNPEDVYYQKLLDESQDEPSIRFMGLKNREEMREIYKQIDVSVCASRSECLQIVTVEGMMHGKMCITTDATGMTEYITDGDNGMVFESENADALYGKMLWCIEHYDDEEFICMRKKARDTYESYFTMEAFGESLVKQLELTKQNWKGDLE